MDERRCAERKTITLPFFVVNSDDGEDAGQVTDLTIHGMGLIGKRGITTGQQSEFLILLTEPVFGKKKISIEVQCVWVKPAQEDGLQLYGFKFTRVSSEDISSILALIYDNAQQ